MVDGYQSANAGCAAGSSFIVSEREACRRLPYVCHVAAGSIATWRCQCSSSEPFRRDRKRQQDCATWLCRSTEEEAGGLPCGTTMDNLLETEFEVGSGEEGIDVGTTSMLRESEDSKCQHGEKKGCSEIPEASSRIQEGYVPLFVRMLGLDSPIEEREEAVCALWSHSANGRECLDEIVGIPGSVNLLAMLLLCGRTRASRAAAGLLSNIASVEEYAQIADKAGAIEGAVGVLQRPMISFEVKVQAAGILVNITKTEWGRKRVADLEVVPLLLTMVQRGVKEEKEAAAEVLSNIAASRSFCKIFAEAGAVHKLASVIITDAKKQLAVEDSMASLRRHCRRALTSLAQDDEMRLDIIAEGLVPVPVTEAGLFNPGGVKAIATATATKPRSEVEGAACDTAPSDPLSGSRPSSDLPPTASVDEERSTKEAALRRDLFGLGVFASAGGGSSSSSSSSSPGTPDQHQGGEAVPAESRDPPTGYDEEQIQREFLARIGLEEGRETGNVPRKNDVENGGQGCRRRMIMSKTDGIPRVVLLLGLSDPSQASVAAEAVAELAILQENRKLLTAAGAIPRLIQLLTAGNECAIEAAAYAIEKMALSLSVKRSFVRSGAIDVLVSILRADDATRLVKAKVASALMILTEGGNTGDQGGSNDEDGDDDSAILSEFVRGEVSGNSGMEGEGDDRAGSGAQSFAGDPRAKIVACGGVAPLIQMMVSCRGDEGGDKAARVLAGIAAEEVNAVALVSSGLVPAIEILLGKWMDAKGIEDAKAEDAWMDSDWDVMSSVARIVCNVLSVERLRWVVSGTFLEEGLKVLLRSKAPRRVKEHVASALLMIEEFKRGPGWQRNGATLGTVDIEVAVHDTIPRLIDQLGGTYPKHVRERAVIQLRNLACCGVREYSAAIAQCGGIWPIVRLLRNASPWAREAALLVLCNLASDSGNIPSIIAAGAARRLECIVREGGPEWKIALSLLRSLPV
ncbi:hypothetical protein CBR_g50426 [Chara braunii]|uniref:Armadillo repeat-containing domain-containing protein n=1 Tax=Chara braunii TaxID=69332 RepID=A0A388M6N3_CHABU|nr:hypothetical protein CBR_g50426 [Chara braunii]|eukprot:GBG90248.1 hypothetical protein CBR_g50426 [Chara braunii]